MRTLIYDSRFKVNEETSIAMAWISFPNLLPTFFVKEYMFSLVVVVGKPIQIVQATINKSRLSCARVKVIVDLRKDFPKVIQMNIENEATGEVRSNTGKARVLSSGRVVGDPRQWDVVKDLRPPEYQLPVAVKNKFEFLTQNGEEEEKKHIKGDEVQQKSNEFEIIDTDKVQNIVSVNIKLYRHDVRKNGNETKVIYAFKEQEPKSNNINVDRDQVQQKNNKIVVNVDDLDEHAVSRNTNNQHKDLIINSTNYVSEMELEIVKVPNVVQIDESHMIQMEYPNRILHDIVSHNLEEIKSLESEENQITKGVIETEESEEI
ncbi:hypothetical protein R3W88_011440 [Solanum pinnatisectum]|uniref:DUF4283 domain-containing protein n=1 Tax=Solanum pinnatisectum TaxID=50273 RepID=A0AAV9L666_9SOLN|nr:hypothetical protein R3W88_011440 [Solanum pinnatisectum]